MKLVYTDFFGCSLSDSGNRRLPILLSGKTNQEQKCFFSSIVIKLTSSYFCNINLSGDIRFRKIKAETFRGLKMVGVRSQKTREIIKPFLRPNIHIPYFGG